MKIFFEIKDENEKRENFDTDIRFESFLKGDDEEKVIKENSPDKKDKSNNDEEKEFLQENNNKEYEEIIFHHSMERVPKSFFYDRNEKLEGINVELDNEKERF